MYWILIKELSFVTISFLFFRIQYHLQKGIEMWLRKWYHILTYFDNIQCSGYGKIREINYILLCEVIWRKIPYLIAVMMEKFRKINSFWRIDILRYFDGKLAVSSFPYVNAFQVSIELLHSPCNWIIGILEEVDSLFWQKML